MFLILFFRTNVVYNVKFFFGFYVKQFLIIFINLSKVQYTESGKEIIKRLTHQCFGLRPKALILELVRLFAIAIECELLLAVTNKSHVYQARKKRPQRIKCSYDALWSEYSASEFNEKFVCLPLDNTYKPLEIVKSKKRAMYRRRYQLLEELKRDCLLVCVNRVSQNYESAIVLTDFLILSKTTLRSN
ncbi:DUF535 family protein [Candidiatus Paracoxiella cheracis]|uniref:DUF535 family protein n=1 Tax=Candidiatus Paracoxiella cheracis TaxID=3405120 RepID=UPI003BF4E4A2